ncbi:MAG: GntP family permease [Halioglobus sp.]|jgi:H+/gluconate symporter-like permease
MVEYLGLLFSVALLIWLALRGVNIIFAALLCSIVVILTCGLPLGKSLTEYFSFGPLGAFTFAGKFFLLFAAGAMFGRVMGESHAAASVALALIRKLGADRALWITVLTCALMTYGGVVIFVVIFAMYPLGLKLLQEADIPKRLFCAALALGAATFTLTALPGTPSIHNVISSVALGTDLFAGGWLGILAGAIMFGAGMWYLERQRLAAKASGEGFDPGPGDRISSIEADKYPLPALAILPLAAVLLTIISPRVISMMLDPDVLAGGDGVLELIRFANSEPILWPSFALFGGTLMSVLLFPSIRPGCLNTIGDGVQDSIMPLINTSAVIGFGGVVTHTEGFQQFTRLMLDSGLPPLISMFLSTSLVSGITGSASGGLQIFMQSMAPAYLAMGIPAEVLHRLATMAAGGFDSLPHSGAVVATLTITGLTHKQAYRDMFVITVLIPVIATVVAMAAAALFY